MNDNFLTNYRGAKSQEDAKRAVTNTPATRGAMQKDRAAQKRWEGTASDDFRNFIDALGQSLAGMIIRRRGGDNVKIIDKTPIPSELQELKPIINLGSTGKYGYGEITDDDIRKNRRSIGYSAYDDSYDIPFLEGDTLGDVINELGIGTKNGLWGPNGDVAYYTLQLLNQGALDKNGNIRPGTIIKLKRRK